MKRLFSVILLCVCLVGCGTSKERIHDSFLDVYTAEGPMPCYLTIDLFNKSYSYVELNTQTNIVGLWQFTNDTLYLEPKVQLGYGSEKVKIDSLDSQTIKNEYLIAKTIKCVFRGDILLELPNTEPFIYQNEDGTISVYPADTTVKVREFAPWRKNSRRIFEYIYEDSKRGLVK